MDEMDTPKKLRRHRFKLKSRTGLRFDKADEATVTITHQDELTSVFEVRPKSARQTFTLPMEEVARMVISIVSKSNAWGNK